MWVLSFAALLCVLERDVYKEPGIIRFFVFLISMYFQSSGALCYGYGTELVRGSRYVALCTTVALYVFLEAFVSNFCNHSSTFMVLTDGSKVMYRFTYLFSMCQVDA